MQRNVRTYVHMYFPVSGTAESGVSWQALKSPPSAGVHTSVVWSATLCSQETVKQETLSICNMERCFTL